MTELDYVKDELRKLIGARLITKSVELPFLTWSAEDERRLDLMQRCLNILDHIEEGGK